VNADVGWVVGAYGTIRKTQNGGSSWSSVSSPVSDELLSIFFQGETEGWISGASGTILKTDDGQTWQEVSTPVTEDLYSIFFINQSRGWACGDYGVVLRSLNGGDTWSVLDLSAYVN
jgi:photosystem II stability/assembly factor-like uncharacterized protein